MTFPSARPRFLAIAWDVDGTLLDSEPLHHRCLIATCQEAGVRLDPKQTEAFLGMTQDAIWAALAAAMPEGLTREAWKNGIIERYVADVGSVEPLPGAVEVVTRFARAGIRQVAVSNSGRRVVDANLRHLGIADLLEGSISVNDVTAGKPAPEPYLKGLALLGLPARAVLAVEDSGTGARAARAAGLTVAGLGVAQSIGGGHPISALAELEPIVLGSPTAPLPA